MAENIGLLNLGIPDYTGQSELLSLGSKKELYIDRSTRSTNLEENLSYAPQITSTYSPYSFKSTTTSSSYAPVNAQTYTYAPQLAYYSPEAQLSSTSKKADTIRAQPQTEIGGATASPYYGISPTSAPTITGGAQSAAATTASGKVGGFDFDTLIVFGVGALLIYALSKA